jgi:hypothetical protein
MRGVFLEFGGASARSAYYFYRKEVDVFSLSSLFAVDRNPKLALLAEQLGLKFQLEKAYSFDRNDFLFPCHEYYPNFSNLFPCSGSSCLFRDKIICYEHLSNSNFSYLLPSRYTSLKRFQSSKKTGIIRPRRSSGSKGVRIVKSSDEFSIDFSREILTEYLPDSTEWVVDYVYGSKFSALPRITHNLRHGADTLVSLTRNLYLESLTKKLCDFLDCKGIGNVQFLQREDKYYFLEISSRFSGSCYVNDLVHYNPYSFLLDQCSELYRDFSELLTVSTDYPLSFFNLRR